MNNRTMGLILFAVGVCILIYAMVLMDVSLYGRVVNLDLLSTRQNLVTIGIVAAVGGLILRFVPTASRTSSRSEEKAAPSAIAQQLERLQLDPIRSVRLASLLLMPIGALLTYKWLFGPIEESSAALLIFGLLLYFGPILASKKYAPDLHPALGRKTWLSVLPLMALIGMWLIFSAAGLY